MPILAGPTQAITTSRRLNDAQSYDRRADQVARDRTRIGRRRWEVVRVPRRTRTRRIKAESFDLLTRIDAEEDPAEAQVVQDLTMKGLSYACPYQVEESAACASRDGEGPLEEEPGLRQRDLGS
jgi:hypothetical protein